LCKYFYKPLLFPPFAPTDPTPNLFTISHEPECFGFILVSKDFLRKVFSKIEKAEDIEEFGRELGLTTAKEYVSYFFPQVNSKSLVQYLDLWFRRFQSYQHRFDNDRNNNNHNPKRHYYTVIHDINMNFSIALKTILEGLIVPIIKSDIEFHFLLKYLDRQEEFFIVLRFHTMPPFIEKMISSSDARFIF
jgi:hypothetical protein